MDNGDTKFNLVLAGIGLVIALATGLVLAANGSLDEVIIIKDKPAQSDPPAQRS